MASFVCRAPPPGAVSYVDFLTFWVFLFQYFFRLLFVLWQHWHRESDERSFLDWLGLIFSLKFAVEHP